MIKNPQNASRGLAKKDEFECTGCHSNTYYPHTDQPMELKVNMIVKGFFEQVFSNLQIFCETHHENLAQRYCSTHRAMLCNICLLETHADHLNVCRALN
jgi:hypothetical protein